ncbi:hypothetical protein LSCM1_04357 [Leishmania martiniquensis]|uniref:Uncharacterized protein n=1 Tax=Leishmania martiniquensis TaxID=1580590 RepID=A0A836G2C6_9TRYP|nr:hypothetical protein LSCM1_04357 [Leishmania martiniquensis]
MLSSLATASALITGASPADASFHSLAYVSALRQCTAFAYDSMLKSVVCSTAATSLYGDGLTECVVRCRLETEREAMERLTAFLLEELPQTPPRGQPRRDPRASKDATSADRASASYASPPTAGARHQSAGEASRGSRTSSARASRRVSGKASERASVTRTTLPGDLSAKEDEAARPFSLFGAAPSFPWSLSAAPTSRRDSAALLLLRVGLYRALGWPVPAALQLKVDGGDDTGGDADMTTEDGSEAIAAPTLLVDTLLSRHSYPNVLRGQRATEPGAALARTSTAATKRAHMFMDMPDTELRHSIVVEWVEDVLVFAHYQCFTTVQTQCVLLDSLLVLDKVDGLPVDSTDAAANVLWEQRVTDALQEVLCAQTCLTVARAIETVNCYQPVTVTVPDPSKLSEITEKLHKTSSQKTLTALEAAKQAPTLVQQTVMQNVEVEVEKGLTLRAVFSMSEAASVAEYITRSVVTHKLLWGTLLAPMAEEQLPAPPATVIESSAVCGSQHPVVHRPICVAVENIRPVYLPPLSAFHSEALQAVLNAQQRLFEACEAERVLQFSRDWQEPLLVIAAHELSERLLLLDTAMQTDSENRAAALTLEQCTRVERAYQLRLEDVLKHNSHVVRSAPPAAPELPSAAAVPEVTAAPPPARGRSSKSKKGSGGPISSPAAAPALSADAAASIQLPTDATFDLAEVEARVDRIAAVLEEVGVAGASSAALERTGNRKR